MFELLYKSFIRTRGYILTTFGILAAIIPLYLGTSLPVKIFIPITMILLIICIVLFDSTFTSLKESQALLPTVKAGAQPPDLFPESFAILLLNPSPLFGHESIVSIYYDDNGIENLVGTGFVLTIQKSGRIQVVVTSSSPSSDYNLWDKVKGNDSNILKSLIVKPTITKTVIEQGV